MRTRTLAIHVVAVALTVLAGPAAAGAQSDPFSISPGPARLDVSVTGGTGLSSDWSDLVLLGSVSGTGGAVEQVLVQDVGVDPAPNYDAIVTYWEGRYGFRVHAGYSTSCLTVARACAVDVTAWTYDIGGAIGMRDYRRGALVWPYFFLGAGGATYVVDETIGAPLTLIERRPARTGGESTVRRDGPDQLLIQIDQLGIETQFAVHLGVGTDVRIPVGPGSVGVRLEVSDYIHRSPLDVRITNLEGFIPALTDADVDFGFVHNLRVAAGFVIQFGR